MLYYHAENDRWDPKDAVMMFQEKFPGELIITRANNDDEVGRDVGHAFVTKDEWVETVAKSIAKFLDESNC